MNRAVPAVALAAIAILGSSLAPAQAGISQELALYPSDALELPNGQLLVLESAPRGNASVPAPSRALLLDPDTGATVGVSAEGKAGMRWASISPSGSHIAAWPHASEVRIWPLDAGVDSTDPEVVSRRKDAEVRIPLVQRRSSAVDQPPRNPGRSAPDAQPASRHVRRPCVRGLADAGRK